MKNLERKKQTLIINPEKIHASQRARQLLTKAEQINQEIKRLREEMNQCLDEAEELMNLGEGIGLKTNAHFIKLAVGQTTIVRNRLTPILADYIDPKTRTRLKVGDIVSVKIGKSKEVLMRVEMAVSGQGLVLVPVDQYKKGNLWRLIRLSLGL